MILKYESIYSNDLKKNQITIQIKLNNRYFLKRQRKSYYTQFAIIN